MRQVRGKWYAVQATGCTYRARGRRRDGPEDVDRSGTRDDVAHRWHCHALRPIHVAGGGFAARVGFRIGVRLRVGAMGQG